jgi:steroid 5-alpha reductase family enzyme
VNVLTLLVANAIAVAVLMGVTALVAKRMGRVVIVDMMWGLGFVLVALVSALVGDTSVRWLLLIMVAIWGCRLGWHTGRRLMATGEEDPRYAELLEGKPFSYAVVRVFLTQGVAMWFVSLPVQVAAASDQGWWSWLIVLGVLVYLVGLAFETIGDRQLAAYKKDPDRPKVMDRGLWHYTRHPNYFGDACVWWGIFLVGVGASRLVLATVLSPAVMTWFLVFATGAKLLERTMMKREGYPEYAERTSMFFPLPPKKRAKDG